MTGAFVCFEDEVGQNLTPPRGRTWDRLNTHRSKSMQQMIADRDWLTVVLLPSYAPDLNPAEAVWSHLKRSLANLAAVSIDKLEALVRNRLKSLQYRPDILNGFLAETGLTFDPQPP